MTERDHPLIVFLDRRADVHETRGAPAVWSSVFEVGRRRCVRNLLSTTFMCSHDGEPFVRTGMIQKVYGL